jgi:hypothetical protein
MIEILFNLWMAFNAIAFVGLMALYYITDKGE